MSCQPTSARQSTYGSQPRHLSYRAQTQRIYILDSTYRSRGFPKRSNGQDPGHESTGHKRHATHDSRVNPNPADLRPRQALICMVLGDAYLPAIRPFSFESNKVVIFLQKFIQLVCSFR